jgi:uncharacterized protein
VKKRFIILFLFSFSSLIAQEDCMLDRPTPKTMVVDDANILSDVQESNLNNLLIKFNQETSNQILVVTVNDLCGYDKSEFTYNLGEKWHVGQKEFDNGIVLMVKPFGNAGDRHTFIAVGYGLEGAIPDAIAKRIVERELIPHFKQNDFNGGILAAINTLMGLAKGEISVEQYQKRDKVPIFPLILVLLIIILVFFSSVRRVQRNALGKDLSFWAALWLLSQSGHRRGGGWHDFNSGGGSFGGGSSFGGFGGGSFGGGGAGGSW